jgi:hypothetical protein
MSYIHPSCVCVYVSGVTLESRNNIHVIRSREESFLSRTDQSDILV